jgi:hypothetical protein
VPMSELRKESAGITILGKVQDVLHQMYNGRVGAGVSRDIADLLMLSIVRR